MSKIVVFFRKRIFFCNCIQQNPPSSLLNAVARKEIALFGFFHLPKNVQMHLLTKHREIAFSATFDSARLTANAQALAVDDVSDVD